MNKTGFITATVLLSLNSCGEADSQTDHINMRTSISSESSHTDDALPQTESVIVNYDSEVNGDDSVSNNRPVNDDFVEDDITGSDTQENEDDSEVIEPMDTAANGDPNIVVFRIRAGIGTGSWNTEATAIRARVGQTIRFINEDTINHRLHTFGEPCAHGSNIQAGSSYDCVASDPYDMADRGALYDHNYGTGAEIWIDVVSQ